AGALVFQSAVLGAAPFTCLALEPSHPPRLVLGAADGSLRFFDLSSLPAARPIQQLDVGKQLNRALTAATAAAEAAAAAAAAGPKVVSSRPAWKAQMGLQRQASCGSFSDGQGGDGDGDDGSGPDAPVNAYVLTLAYAPAPSATHAPHAPHAPLLLPDISSPHGSSAHGGGAVDDLALLGLSGPSSGPSGPHLAALHPGAAPLLLVAMAGAVAVVDVRCYEVTDAFLLGRTTASVGGGYSGAGGAAAGSLPSAGAVPSSLPPLRPRMHLRGLPRAEPCGCAALAISTAAVEDLDSRRTASHNSGGEAASYGLVLCSAASREPTVSILRYDASAAADAASGSEGSTPGGGSSSAATPSIGLRPRQNSAGRRFSGSEGAGSEDGDRDDVYTCATGSGSEPVISVFQSGPLPEDSPLRAASPAGPRLSGNGSGPGPGPGSGQGPSGAPNRAGSGVGSGSSGSRFVGVSPGRSGRPPPAPSGSGSGSSRAGSGRGPSAGGKGGSVLDKPVTFHSKIKSSGYGFVQAPHQLGRAPPKPVKLPPKAQASSSVSRYTVEARQYPLDAGPLTAHQPRNALPGNAPVHPGGAIVRIAYSSDASRLLTASVCKTARVMKLPLSRWGGEGTDLVGHNGPLHGADWSREGTLVLTASADRTARLWNAACAQPLLEFSHLNHQPPPRTAGGPAGTPAAAAAPPSPAAAARAANPLLQHEVRAARFVCMDQLIALAAGNKLLLYRYKLAEDAESDIERLRARHTYRLAAAHTSAAQALLDFSVVNSFLSPLAIISGSNRSLELLDLAAMRLVASELLDLAAMRLVASELLDLAAMRLVASELLDLAAMRLVASELLDLAAMLLELLDLAAMRLVASELLDLAAMLLELLDLAAMRLVASELLDLAAMLLELLDLAAMRLVASELLDLAAMRLVASVPDAHQRPVGCVAQAGTASLFVSHPREAYELFATSAPDGAVKLWDVRQTQRCVRAFAGHKNSQLPSLAVSFSPCLRFLGAGSEDKQAYLYDIRQGVVAHKVGRGSVSDAVTGVAFSPLYPQMALACLDGKVHFYADGGEGRGT
ncbi:hypothetical protein HYH03_014550, partial [Edaphochlamys debaryana]